MQAEIWHYGIKGQQKGVRRFQNEDGSYTEEGKRRYGIGDGIEGIVSRQPKDKPHIGTKSGPYGAFRYKDPNQRMRESEQRIKSLVKKDKNTKDDENINGQRYDTSKKRNDFLKTLNGEQRRLYNSLQYRDQKKLWKKLSQGKDFDKACAEMNREAALTALGVSAALLYINPVTRGFMKSLGKHAMQAVKNSNIAKKGSLWMKKFMTRRSMMKNGAVVLKKSAYSVRDIPFGGYLSR